MRSFSAAAVMHDFPGYHWIYWLGPVLGASMAAGYYRFAKYMNYEQANPGQDAISPDEQAEEQERHTTPEA